MRGMGAGSCLAACLLAVMAGAVRGSILDLPEPAVYSGLRGVFRPRVNELQRIDVEEFGEGPLVGEEEVLESEEEWDQCHSTFSSVLPRNHETAFLLLRGEQVAQSGQLALVDSRIPDAEDSFEPAECTCCG